MSPHSTELFDTDDIDQASRNVVKNVTAEIESRLFEMTVNAKDWYAYASWPVKRAKSIVRETYYTAKTARQILWKDDDSVPLQDWVPVSQKSAQMNPNPANFEPTDWSRCFLHPTIPSLGPKPR